MPRHYLRKIVAFLHKYVELKLEENDVHNLMITCCNNFHKYCFFKAVSEFTERIRRTLDKTMKYYKFLFINVFILIFFLSFAGTAELLLKWGGGRGGEEC